jgi:hypothetical protein
VSARFADYEDERLRQAAHPLRDPEVMRRENAAAFGRIYALLAARRELITSLTKGKSQ